MTREEEILSQAKLITGLFSFRNGLQTPEDAYVSGAKWADAHPVNPWHKVSEELPEMAHFTAGGDYSDLCVCINESGEHKILVLCEQGDYTYWAYGYDGEDMYDEEMEGEIVKWMKIPKED